MLVRNEDGTQDQVGAAKHRNGLLLMEGRKEACMNDEADDERKEGIAPSAAGQFDAWSAFRAFVSLLWVQP